jgi:hypothetical protein
MPLSTAPRPKLISTARHRRRPLSSASGAGSRPRRSVAFHDHRTPTHPPLPPRAVQAQAMASGAADERCISYPELLNTCCRPSCIIASPLRAPVLNASQAILGAAGSQAERHRHKRALVARRMEERVAPALLDEMQLQTDRAAASPSALAAQTSGKRCVKADSPTPASLSQGCTPDPTVDDGVAPRFERTPPSAGLRRREGEALPSWQDGLLKHPPRFELKKSLAIPTPGWRTGSGASSRADPRTSAPQYSIGAGTPHPGKSQAE